MNLNIWDPGAPPASNVLLPPPPGVEVLKGAGSLSAEKGQISVMLEPAANLLVRGLVCRGDRWRKRSLPFVAEALMLAVSSLPAVPPEEEAGRP